MEKSIEQWTSRKDNVTWRPLSSFWQGGAPKKPKILGMSNAKVNYYLKRIAQIYTKKTTRRISTPF